MIKRSDIRTSFLTPIVTESTMSVYKYITHCGHYLASSELAVMGERQRGYSPIEYCCAVCKRPFNVLLPMYPRPLMEGMMRPKTPGKTPTITLEKIVKALIDLDLDNIEVCPLFSNKCIPPEDTSVYDQCIADLMKLGLSMIAHMAYLQEEDLLPYSQDPPFTDIMSLCIAEYIRHSLHTGWASRVNFTVLPYVSLYQTIRLGNVLFNKTESWHKKDSTLFQRLMANMAVLMTPSSDPVFQRLDLHTLYLFTMILFMQTIPLESDLPPLLSALTEWICALRIQQWTLTLGLTSSKLSWDTIKYSQLPEMQPLVHSILKILRMGALMKYIMQYPRVSKSSQSINSREQDIREGNAGQHTTRRSGNRLPDSVLGNTDTEWGDLCARGE